MNSKISPKRMKDTNHGVVSERIGALIESSIESLILHLRLELHSEVSLEMITNLHEYVYI